VRLVRINLGEVRATAPVTARSAMTRKMLSQTNKVDATSRKTQEYNAQRTKSACRESALEI